MSRAATRLFVIPGALCAILFVLLYGCAAKRESARHNNAIQDYRNIFVTPFICPDQEAGKIVSDKIARKFEYKGFSVLRLNKPKGIAKRDKESAEDLQEPDNKMLASRGVAALVVGSTTKYGCQPKKEWVWTGYAPKQLSINACTASVALKLVDIHSGTILWEAEASHSETAAGMIERIALEWALAKIGEKIPTLK